MKQSVTVLEMRADHVYVRMYVCIYVHFCVYRTSSLFSCCYIWQNLLVSVCWYLLLIHQTSCKFMDFSISYSSVQVS